MIFSTSRAKLRFSGYGMPWLRMVLSSATTGLAGANGFLNFRGNVHVGFQIKIVHLIYSFTIFSIAAGDISRLMVSLEEMATMPAPMPNARTSSAV